MERGEIIIKQEDPAKINILKWTKVIATRMNGVEKQQKYKVGTAKSASGTLA